MPDLDVTDTDELLGEAGVAAGPDGAELRARKVIA